jgi:exodeoxyribonuclease VII small subunit
LAKSPAPPSPPDSLSFEAAVKELESIVSRMESDELALEDSLAAYKRGVELVRTAQQRLTAAEQQVRILEEGVLKPFEPDGDVS